MKGELGDEARIRHIYDAILEIEAYLIQRMLTLMNS